MSRTGASMARGQSKQDFGTPWNLMSAIIARFGPIAWDLAASPHNTKCANFFTKEQDSFKQAWHKIRGNLYLNPEFNDIDPWAEKCVAEAALGARIIFLTPASIGSNWFARHVYQKAHVIALNGRPSFDGIAPYPKDCMLTLFHEPWDFTVWRWTDDALI